MIIRSHAPIPPPAVGAADEFSIEAALERELSILQRGLDPDEEAQVIKAFSDLRTEAARITPACRDALGIRSARSRYDAVQAVAEAWAAEAFHGQPDGTSPAATLETARPDESRRFAGALQLAGGNLGGEPPPELSAEDPRIILGRIYNRLIRPDIPLEWVRLLPDRAKGHPLADQASLQDIFLSAGEAVAPGAAGEILHLAREAARRDLSPGRRSAPVSRTVPGSPMVSLRQIVGRSITGGSARGIAHHSGNPVPKSRYVLICGRFTSEILDELTNADALVEIQGAGFGPGAVAALEHGIPHLYQAAEAGSIPEGENVEVNGDTRLLIRYEQK